MKNVRWGLIGCGDVAERKGGPALYAVAHSELVAVMSRTEKKAKDFAERHGAKRYYTSVEDLLADEEVNAVYVATPPHVHAELTIAAAEAGKHVLCEKPMALTVAECEQMIQACQQHGVQLMIAYYRRFFPVVVEMKRRVDAGAIGRPLHIRAEVSDLYAPAPDGERAWRIDPAVAGGGFLTDVATHRLDLMVHFLGRVREVAAFTDTLRFDFEVDDSNALILRFEDGAHASAAFYWSVGAAIDEFEICGTEGRLLARDLGRGALEVFTDGEREELRHPAPAITHLGLVTHFVQCLRAGEGNALPGEEGMQATRLTEAAYRSSREGSVVRLTS